MKSIFICIIAISSLACGIKGDPLPPEEPTSIGRGKPTYERALRNVKVKDVKGKAIDPDDEDADKNDEENEDENN